MRWAKCHFALASMVGFFGIGFLLCQVLFISVLWKSPPNDSFYDLPINVIKLSESSVT